MTKETKVALTSLQRIIYMAMTFSGMFFTLNALGAGYWNQCVSLQTLIIFAIIAYLSSIPFAIFFEFFIAPHLKRGK